MPTDNASPADQSRVGNPSPLVPAETALVGVDRSEEELPQSVPGTPASDIGPGPGDVSPA